MTNSLKLLVIAAAFGLSACASAPPSLYDRLGGQPAITAVVDDFIGNVAADPVINKRFLGVDVPKLKVLLVEQICSATGGPCRYTGRAMKESHRGQDITDADFNAMVGDLVKTLDKFKVPEREKTELLTLLSPMRPDIVGQ